MGLQYVSQRWQTVLYDGITVGFLGKHSFLSLCIWVVGKVIQQTNPQEVMAIRIIFTCALYIFGFGQKKSTKVL